MSYTAPVQYDFLAVKLLSRLAVVHTKMHIIVCCVNIFKCSQHMSIYYHYQYNIFKYVKLCLNVSQTSIWALGSNI